MTNTVESLPQREEVASSHWPYVAAISLIAALGGLLFGYDFVVIGGARLFFEPYFGLDDAMRQGWANSCALLGCLLGSLAAGVWSDRFGRKRLLIFSAILFAVTSIGNGLADTFTVFVLWRITGGMAIGLASNLSPMYIAEVAPAAMRGRLVSINQLTIVLGILLAQAVNWWIGRGAPAGTTTLEMAHSWYGQYAWRWMFALTAIPACCFFLGLFAVPESPRWLARNGRREAARKVLVRIGGEEYASAAMTQIESTLGDQSEKVDFRALLDPKLTRVLTLGIVLAVFQQWCGINVIFNYAKEVFFAAGYDLSDTLMNIAWTGSVNLAFTLAAFGIVDRGGRRPLLLGGALGLAVIYGLLGWCFQTDTKGLAPLALVLAAIGCFAMTLGPTAWVVISEIFPNRIRGAAMAVAVASLWIGCFVLTYTFPLLNYWLGAAGTFWVYAGICLAGLAFLTVRLPETKGKSLEQIERELVG